MSRRRLRESNLTLAERTALAHGYSAGNADNAYVSENFDKARSQRKPKAHARVWWCGYVLGFFSSYETNEVPRRWRGLLISAYRKCGAAAQAQGIAVDPRP